MLTYTQAIILGLLQGISELFPISSLWHSIILTHLLGWNIDKNGSFFLPFLVGTHLATALVLFFFFWSDWKVILIGMWRSLVDRRIDSKNTGGILGWYLVVGTIPAGLVGLILEKKIQGLFASAISAAFFLILNGIVLYGAEILRRKAVAKQKSNNPEKHLTKLSWTKAFGVGIVQIIALIPGFSRSGSTMAGGLLVGLSHEDAARYSFLLATPIIGAAAALKISDLFNAQNIGLIGPAIVGALFAGLGAYLAVKFLMKYFETNKLTPFAIYCVIAGLLSLAFLWMH